MYDFFLQISLFASLGVIVYMLARTMPRVSDGEEMSHNTSAFDRFLRHLPLSKIDSRLNELFEKTLRKLKVLVMRIDNFINTHLSKLRKNGKTKDTTELHARLFEKMNDDTKE